MPQQQSQTLFDALESVFNESGNYLHVLKAYARERHDGEGICVIAEALYPSLVTDGEVLGSCSDQGIQTLRERITQEQKSHHQFSQNLKEYFSSQRTSSVRRRISIDTERLKMARMRLNFCKAQLERAESDRQDLISKTNIQAKALTAEKLAYLVETCLDTFVRHKDSDFTLALLRGHKQATLTAIAAAMKEPSKPTRILEDYISLAVKVADGDFADILFQCEEPLVQRNFATELSRYVDSYCKDNADEDTLDEYLTDLLNYIAQYQCYKENINECFYAQVREAFSGFYEGDLRRSCRRIAALSNVMANSAFTPHSDKKLNTLARAIFQKLNLALFDMNFDDFTRVFKILNIDTSPLELQFDAYIGQLILEHCPRNDRRLMPLPNAITNRAGRIDPLVSAGLFFFGAAVLFDRFKSAENDPANSWLDLLLLIPVIYNQLCQYRAISTTTSTLSSFQKSLKQQLASGLQKNRMDQLLPLIKQAGGVIATALRAKTSECDILARSASLLVVSDFPRSQMWFKSLFKPNSLAEQLGFIYHLTVVGVSLSYPFIAIAPISALLRAVIDRCRCFGEAAYKIEHNQPLNEEALALAQQTIDANLSTVERHELAHTVITMLAIILPYTSTVAGLPATQRQVITNMLPSLLVAQALAVARPSAQRSPITKPLHIEQLPDDEPAAEGEHQPMPGGHRREA